MYQGEETRNKKQFQETLNIKEDFNSYGIVSKKEKQSEIEGSKQSLVPLNGNGQFICEKCNKVFTYKQSLQLHIRSAHEGASYSCSHCDYKANTNGNLKQHIESVHNGVRYPCNWCDYKATLIPRITLVTFKNCA